MKNPRRSAHPRTEQPQEGRPRINTSLEAVFGSPPSGGERGHKAGSAHRAAPSRQSRAATKPLEAVFGEPPSGGEAGSEDGGAERDRTANLCVANAALSQLSYGPTRLGIPDREIRDGGR
jgi:hypothetical protein